MQAPKSLHLFQHGALNRRQWLSLTALPALLALHTRAASEDKTDVTLDTLPGTWAAVHQRWTAQTWLLLGEVHDNVAQHRLRHDFLQALVENGWRPVLLMEQFDREHQGAIDAAMRQPGASAQSIVDTAGRSGGWDWPLYLPFIELAQVARDQFMARALAQHGAQGAVLLAGNGHIRKDIGVPRWLPPQARPRTLSVGLLEAGDTQRSAYDEVVVTAPQARPDPCADFKASATPQPAASSRP